MKKRLYSSVDCIHSRITFFNPKVNTSYLCISGTSITAADAQILRDKVNVIGSPWLDGTTAMLTFAKKTVNFRTAIGELVATYTYDFVTPGSTYNYVDDAAYTRGSYGYFQVARLIRGGWKMKQNYDGDLIMTLLPDMLLPVIDGMGGKVITSVDVNLYDGTNTKRAMLEASVSNYGGSGTIKMNDNTARAGGEIRLMGMDDYVIKMPRSFDLVI